MNRGDVLLTATGITKNYHKEKNTVSVIRGVDFTLHAGEMVAITGASGVGKSTLLHVLGTLEPPSTGKVKFTGFSEDLFLLPEKQLAYFRNRILGFVFQFHYLLPEFSALENVMMPALISGVSTNQVQKLAKDLLHFVGLGARVHHRPAELSGGEQQRVAIARAVIMKPKLILADELTGNLDSQNSMMIMDLLGQLNQSLGVSVLLVTHDMRLAEKMHRVVTMRDGKVV